MQNKVEFSWKTMSSSITIDRNDANVKLLEAKRADSSKKFRDEATKIIYGI